MSDRNFGRTAMQCEIGVIGNGMVGKATALGFAQAGFRVILLCPSKASITAGIMSPEWDARVFALNHRTKNLLNKLKVWDALDLQRVTPIESMKIVGADRADDSRLALLFDAYTAHQNELAWIVEDQNINQALDSALRFAPDITMVAGKAATMSPDFSKLTLENGLSLGADLWVGADGAHSWLRNKADISLDYRSYEQRGVVANFSCSKPHHGVAHQWFLGEQGIIALLPLTGQQVSLVWSAPEALATTLCMENPQQLAQRLMHYCAPALGELAPLSPYHIQSFPLQFIKPHSMIGPQMALVGDAAHVIHPLAGHGLNLGFGDVSALLETVTERETWRGCGDVRVLQRYARARKEDVLLMQIATDGLARLFGSQLATIQTGRHIGMNLVNKLPFLKKQLIQQAMG
jgi:ubiquinone biosynthesis UbiH/UbiF/VisC/COQ6 family hydroxylase